jgi:hypothetical protein
MLTTLVCTCGDQQQCQQEYDSTYAPRVLVLLLAVVTVLIACGSYLGACATPLQGRMIYDGTIQVQPLKQPAR